MTDIMKIISAITTIVIIFYATLAAPEICPRSSEPPKESNPKALQTPLPLLDEIQRGCSRFGTPILRFVVTQEGKTKKHKYLRGTGCASADKELLAWLKKWSYAPATHEGKPVEKTVTVVVNWSKGSPEK